MSSHSKIKDIKSKKNLKISDNSSTVKNSKKQVSGTESAPKTRFSFSSLGIKALAVTMTLVTLVTITSSAWYFNDFMRETATKRTIPTSTTRSLSRNMQKVTYAPAISFALRIVASSVELDLGVTIIDEYDAIVAGYPFEVTIQPTGEGDPVTQTDDDKDGQVYFEGLAAGEYSVALTKAEGYVVPEPVSATVQPKVTYERVDVSDKIVSSDDIDASTDDKQFGGNNGADSGNSSSKPPTSNTVEFVASSSKTETKTTTIDKIVNGVQVYSYKPSVSANNLLLLSDGTESDLIAVLDASGYLVKGQRAVDDGITTPPTPPTDPTTPPVDPAVPPPTPPEVNGDPNTSTGTGGVTYVDVNLIDASYNLLNDPTTGKAFKSEKIKVTETKTAQITTYYGWQTLNGKTYYYDKNGTAVVGWHVIQGITYFFASDGARGGNIGIDVSTWQGAINWSKVKASGVDYVFVRLGFRGYGTGKLVIDNMYHQHMQGAIAAGLKVGVYFFTQAINATEAVEEASMCLQLVKGYKITYPIAIDIEWAASDARTNGLTTAQRTEICRAFCETIKNAGYTPSVYANKYYFTSLLNTAQLESYVIWLAHYTEQTSYSRRYDIWQYTSTGNVPGVAGGVDMNISYLGY